MADEERDEIHVLTNDTIADPAGAAGGRDTTHLDPADQQIYQQAVTGEGLIKIESAEQLEALARLAVATQEEFDADAVRIMTAARAAEVRRLRVDEGYSWRVVAHPCQDAWSVILPEDIRDGWRPPSNKLMGIAPCEAAARQSGEDSMQKPWKKAADGCSQRIRETD